MLSEPRPVPPAWHERPSTIWYAGAQVKGPDVESRQPCEFGEWVPFSMRFLHCKVKMMVTTQSAVRVGQRAHHTALSEEDLLRRCHCCDVLGMFLSCPEGGYQCGSAFTWAPG